jgi:hypothetical protein
MPCCLGIVACGGQKKPSGLNRLAATGIPLATADATRNQCARLPTLLRRS